LQAISFCGGVRRKRYAGKREIASNKIMKKILLLSDTHSHIDEVILKYVQQADECGTLAILAI